MCAGSLYKLLQALTFTTMDLEGSSLEVENQFQPVQISLCNHYKLILHPQPKKEKEKEKNPSCFPLFPALPSYDFSSLLELTYQTFQLIQQTYQSDWITNFIALLSDSELSFERRCSLITVSVIVEYLKLFKWLEPITSHTWTTENMQLYSIISQNNWTLQIIFRYQIILRQILAMW